MNDIRLPRGWQKKKLVDISDVKGGKRLPKGYELSDSFNGFPYIRVADMYMGGINLENIKYVPLEVVESIKNYKITVEDLFISVAGTIGIVGEVPSVLNNANLTENADKITNIKIDKGYLLEYLKSSIIQSVISREMTTSAQPKLAIERIKKFEIRYPQDRKEQQKIAKILSTIDKNIEKTIEIIEKYKKVKNGLMDDLLTGKIRIKDGKWIKETEFKYLGKNNRIPKNWENGSIASLANVNPKKDTKKLGKEDLVSFIRMEDTSEQAKILNMEDKKLHEVEKGYTNFHENDVLFAKITPCLENGKGGLAIGLTNGIGFGSTEFHVLRVKRKESEMLVYQYSKYFRLRKKAMSLMIGSAGQQRIGKEFFERYKIGIPSISEQKAIGEILNKQDQLIEKEEQYLQKLQKLKNGLMNDLLTGKKRVKID